MSYSKEIGRIGEQLVADYLKHKGFIILSQNYYGKYGELDIVAENPERVIFVEVKTRKKDSLMTGFNVVDKVKQSKLIRTAGEFLRKLHYTGEYRFDIAEVTYFKDDLGQNKFSLNYIKNAFQADVPLGGQNL